MSFGLTVLEKKLKIDFKDGGNSSHVGLPFRTILAIFDVQVTKFGINWPFGSGEEAKNRFLRCVMQERCQ